MFPRVPARVENLRVSSSGSRSARFRLFHRSSVLARLRFLGCGLLLLLLNLEQQSAVDVGQNTTKGNGGANKGVELFITANGELQVARGDALDL